MRLVAPDNKRTSLSIIFPPLLKLIGNFLSLNSLLNRIAASRLWSASRVRGFAALLGFE